MQEFKYIKYLVEKESGINDISVKTRKRHYVYARSVFFAIAVMKLELVGVASARFLKLDHATQLNAKKNHDETYMNQKEYRKMYYRCCESYAKNKGIDILTENEKTDYKTMSLDLSNFKTTKEINSHKVEKYKPLMEQLYNLPEDLLNEFMSNRVVPFLKMYKNQIAS